MRARMSPFPSPVARSLQQQDLNLVAPDYTVKFVWIMAKYQACSQYVIAQLLRTPTITKHVAKFRERLAELTATREPEADGVRRE